MEKRDIYVLTESQLRDLIIQSVNEAISESDDAFLGITFGLQQRRRNRQQLNLFNNKYTQKYLPQLTTIVNTIRQRERTLGIIAANTQQVTEGVGTGVGRGVTRAAVKQTGKKLAKRAVVGAGFFAGMMGADYASNYIQTLYDKLANPELITTDDLLAMYSELCNNVIGACLNDIERYPIILGSEVFNQGKLYNGSNQGGPIFTDQELKDMAVNFGVSILATIAGGPIGIIYDTIDLVGTLVASKAWSDEEKLKQIGEMDKHIQAAISEFMRVLNISQKTGIEEFKKLLVGTSSVPLNKTNRATQLSNMRPQQPVPQVNTTAVRQQIRPGTIQNN